MTSDTQQAESGSSIGRRTFIKGVGAAGAAGVGLSGRAPGGLSPVGSADALPPLVVAGGYAVGTAASGVTVGYALRELEIIGADTPTDGLGPDALWNQTYQTLRTRESTNASTIIDNNNLVNGIVNLAYTDGKIAAIEELNRDSSLEAVQDAADTAAAEYLATVERNLMESWNESVRELKSLVVAVESTSGVSQDNVWTIDHYGGDDSRGDSGLQSELFGERTITLADGSNFVIEEPGVGIMPDETGSESDTWTPEDTSETNIGGSSGYYIEYVVKYNSPDSETQREYLDADEWGPLWEDLQGAVSTALGGLQNWSASVYEEVQSGSIDLSDLLTPREKAELLSDDEEYPHAVADLIALNIPVDPDREATISFTDRDITISGLMAPTSPPEGGFNVGETYDPSAEPWDLYFTYDPSRGSGGWSEYEELIAEGELRFTEEPYDGVLYRVPTNLGTVEVVSDDFEEIDGGLWAADVSEQLGRTTEEWTDYQTGVDGGTVTFGSLPDEAAEFDITTNQGDTETVAASDFEADGENWTVETSLGIAEVESVTAHIDRATIEEAISIYSEDGSANYETVQIREEFTLDRLEDSDGNEVDSAEFSQTEPQDDTNYITQEEWDDLEQQNQELIDKYEEAASSDDGFFGGGGFDFGEIGEIPAGATAAAAGVAVVVVIVGVLRQVASFYLPGR